VDRTRGYVGSANLTSAGLARNIEIGVELAGPDVADLAQILSALERLGASVKAVHAGKRQLRKGD
jgi:phosphatidylserine/phosphatidylglycerophosphate/cardiolipin synthase-like enzyme